MTQISDIFLQRIARIIRIFRRKRRRWPDAEQSEWQEPPRLKIRIIRAIRCGKTLPKLKFMRNWLRRAEGSWLIHDK